MKRVLGLAVATVLLIPGTARAEWVYVTSAQNIDFLVEDSSINTQNDTVQFWQQDAWKTPFRGQVKTVLTHYSVDCSSNVATVINSIPYNSNGKPLNNPALAYTAGLTKTYAPGTAGYTIGKTVCGN